MIDLEKISEQACDAVREVGDYVAQSQSNIKTVVLKSIKNFQTDVDVTAENILRGKLHTILPEAGFIVEEGEDTQDVTEYRWAVDPIDGTKYFSTLYPVFFTQIALLKGDETIFAVIYTPVHKQMFRAIKGGGTYLNNTRMNILYDGPLKDSLVNLELGRIDEGSPQLELFNILSTKVNRVILASGIFAPYLITNTVQAYINLYNLNGGPNAVYDLAPRWLIHEEAGARRNTYTYLGQKLYISAHPKLVAEIEEILGISSQQ